MAMPWVDKSLTEVKWGGMAIMTKYLMGIGWMIVGFSCHFFLCSKGLTQCIMVTYMFEPYFERTFLFVVVL